MRLEAGSKCGQPVRRGTRMWHGLLATACLAAGGACAQQEGVNLALADHQRGSLPPQLSLSVASPLPGTALPGSVDIGLRWRQPLLNQRAVDITAWRRVPPPADALSMVEQRDPVYGARFEMKLKSSTPQNLFADKFIGMQLDSGARIGIRRSNGNPTIYYRNQF